MKIIQVTSHFIPFVGGDAKHVYQISKRLVERGHEVIVYTTTNIEVGDTRRLSLTFPFFHLPHTRSVVQKEENIEGITVKRFKPMLQVAYGFFTPILFFELLKEDADIIHAHLYGSSEVLFAAIVSNVKKMPLVWTAHGGMRIASKVSEWVMLSKKLYDELVGKYIVKSSKKLIALTKDNISDYLNLGAKRHDIAIIPNGVELELYQKIPDSQEFRQKYRVREFMVLYVGRLEEHKGVQYLLKAAELVLKKYPQTTFLIVGDGNYRDKLIKLAKYLNINSNAIFTGLLPDDELLRAYSAADIFVLPSRHEGFGIVILEAMASGLPVISFGSSAMQHIIEDHSNGILVKPFSSYDLSKAIIELIDNENLRKKLIEGGIRSVKKRYTWDIVVDKIERMYIEIADM